MQMQLKQKRLKYKRHNNSNSITGKFILLIYDRFFVWNLKCSIIYTYRALVTQDCRACNINNHTIIRLPNMYNECVNLTPYKKPYMAMIPRIAWDAYLNLLGIPIS
jgi:hypothetical protein